MRKRLILLVALTLTVAASTAWADHGGVRQQTLTLFRAHCGTVATAAQQAANRVGSVQLAARADDRARDGHVGMRLETSIVVQHGVPNTTYRVFLLRRDCAVQLRRGLLTTDAHGVGQKSLEVRNLRLPAGRYAVQLVAPPDTTITGHSPTDVLTTRFGLLVPPPHHLHHR